MLIKLKNILDKFFLPRWIVLTTDIVITSTTFLFTYLLRLNLFSKQVDVPMVMIQLIAGFPFFILAVLLFKPHRGIIRHSTTDDVVALLKTQLVFSTGYFLISYYGHLFNQYLVIPWSVIIVHFFLSVFLMAFFRFLFQYVYRNLVAKPNDTVNIMIYGAGVMGNIACNVIKKDFNIHYNIVGYIDDNPQLWNSTIGGVTVFPPQKAFGQTIRDYKVQQIVLAISNSKIDITWKRDIVDRCLANHLKVKEVADPSSILDGNHTNGQIRNVRIEDLLGREPISMKMDLISSGIFGKRIMVTGGAGSIGSEIVRQLVYLKPQSIIIVDQAESAIFHIQNEILLLLDETILEVYVADVTNEIKMQRIFEKCHPQIIFHAAAYKHVPIMELQPHEAISNNIGGTKDLADMAVKYNVEKFVLVSTDKAVNPTNIMGATKRICEIYIQSLSQHTGMKTQFITTRFGNVLGSNGSVIPTFNKQISSGGPVTVTHRDVIRYFMTIPEACTLVLEAGLMGQGGEIYLFHMGSPVRIYDLAERMISLSGFIPHKEVKIIEIGLRLGEKMYEELLTGNEETLPTDNPKIMIGKIRSFNYKLAEENINKLLENLTKENDWQLVSRMKEIVPEFISKNSQFEVLDIVNTT
jgi:FlaA1/EpsC-like NDP-sugar epimerase